MTTTSTTPPRLPAQAPAPDVVPGPVRAEPLPADRPVRWGILATGKIATAFVKDLALLEECEVAALVALVLFMGIAHIDTVDPSLVDDPGWCDLLHRRVPQLVL